MVGLISDFVSDDDDTGPYIEAIPSPLVLAFLNQTRENPGGHLGPATLPMRLQLATNPSLRRYTGSIHIPYTGVLIYKTTDVSLRAGDLLVDVDGHTVSTDGTVLGPKVGNTPVFVDYLAASHTKEDSLSIGVLRKGRRLQTQIKLTYVYPLTKCKHLWTQPDARLFLSVVPYPSFHFYNRATNHTDNAPDFLILAGLVFTDLTKDYLLAFGTPWTTAAPADLVYHVEDGKLPAVVLCDILPDVTTHGYEDMLHSVVTTLNNRPIRSLDDLRRALFSPEETVHPWLIFLLNDGQRLVLNRNAIEDATARVLKTYNIGSSRMRINLDRLNDRTR